jgi:hypothetical protein
MMTRHSPPLVVAAVVAIISPSRTAQAVLDGSFERQPRYRTTSASKALSASR